MINARIKVTLTGSTALDKNANFALASALTLTAKEIQTSIIKEIEGRFSVRSNWDKPSNIYGVRVKAATKQSLEAWIGTAADWLEKFVQEPAGAIVIKTPTGDYLAIPTKNVRRTKRDIVSKAQRPRAILGKRDFVILTKRGVRVLFQRRGRGKTSRLIAMYILVPLARIREQDVIAGPTEKVFMRRFESILSEQTAKAYATAR